MATNTWISSGSTDMNLATNWSLGALSSTDNLVFDSTSSVNAIASSGVVCDSCNISGNYGGAFSLNTYSITCAGNSGFSVDASGTHNFGSGITLNGISGTLHFGSGISSTSSGTNCTITFNGTSGCIYDDDKGMTGSTTALKGYVLGSGAKVSTTGSTTTGGRSTSGTFFTLGNNSTLTSNQVLQVLVAGNSNIWSLGSGATINGSGAITIRNNANSVITTLSGLSYTGTGSITFDNAAGITPSTFSLSGNMDIGNAILTTYNTRASTSGAFNLNGFSITCGSFRPGCTAVDGTYTLNIGSGTINCSDYTSQNATYTTGAANINLQTGTINCSGNLGFGTGHTVDAGTSLVNFVGSGASSVTSNGKSFYDVVVNNASKAFTFTDATSLHNLTTTAMASYTHTGTTLVSNGNINYDGAGTLNLGNGITMTGTSSTLHLGSTVGTVTATSCAVSFAGTTAPTLDDDKATTFKSLTFTGLNPVAASTGTSNTTFKSSSPLTFANGGTLTITNGRIFLNQDATGNIITISSGTPTIVNNGAGVFNFGIGANSVTATIPAISMSGSAGYAFINIGAGYTSGLFDFSGNFSTGTASLTMTARESPSDITFKINGNVFTCGAFTFGCPNIDGKATLIGNGGTINATSWAASNAAYTTGFAVDNMQTSTRNISGSYTVGANHTINAGTSSINLYGTSGVLTTNGKTLYDVYIHNHTTINDGCTFHKLAWGTDGKQITFEAGNTFTLTSLDATDWSGSVGQLNKMISSVPTTAYTIAIPNTITASYMDVTDCTITGGNINVYDGTSTDGGNNSATWVWTAPPATDTIASNLIRDLIIDIDVRVGISVGV